VFFFHFISHLFPYLFLTVPLEHERKLPERINKAQACDQSPLGEEKPHQGEKSEKDTRPPWHDNNGSGVEEEPEVSELTLSTLRSKGKTKKEKKAAASGWGIPAAEEAPVLVDGASASEEASPAPEHFTHDMGWKWPRYEAWNFGATRDVPAEPHTAAGEAIPAEEPCFAALEGASHTDEPYNIVPEEEPIPEDTFPAREAVSNEDSMGTETVAPDATLEASQAEVIIEDFDDAEEHTFNQHDNIPYDLDDPYELISELDVALMHNASAEDAEFFIASLRPALSVLRNDFDFDLFLLALLFVIIFVFKVAAPGTPTKNNYIIMFKMFNGSKIFKSIVFIKTYTRTVILKKTKIYYVKYI